MNTASAEQALTGEDAVAPATAIDDGAAVASSVCPHCGVGVEGGADTFCCHGCEAAFAIIHEAGLERYYESRTDLPPRPEPWRERWDALAPPPDADGRCEMRLAIDGLRCASCVWVTERVLRSTPGVIDAQVSYATGRATLTWDPEVVPAGELARRIATLGYRPRVLGRESGVDRSLLTRLGVSAFAATNVMMFSAALYAGWLGPMDAGFVALFRWGSLVLATPVALWAASPFFEGAWSGLRHRVLHMDLPIAIAIGVLYLQGIAGTLVGFDTYLDSLTMLVTLLLAGRVLESGGRRKAADAALTLAATVPSTARRTHGDSVEVVASSALVPGDRISVGAGEDLPADGVVVAGQGRLQRSLLTGESVPVAVREGDEVWAGTVLVDGAVTVVVSVPTEETVVQQMAARLRRAADEALTPGASDRIAPWFTGVTLGVATITFLAWLPVVGAGQALSITVAVLIVACPCALALSRPLTAAAGLGAAARRGLLFRSPDALLASADVDLVALDKTGTLTEGGEVVAHASDEHLRIAAGLERFSRHPLAVAIVACPCRKPRTFVRRPVSGFAGVWTGRTGRSGRAARPGCSCRPGESPLERSWSATGCAKTPRPWWPICEGWASRSSSCPEMLPGRPGRSRRSWVARTSGPHSPRKTRPARSPRGGMPGGRRSSSGMV